MTLLPHRRGEVPFARNAIFIFGGLLGVLVLVRLVFVRSWNYDELSHAHMAWLVSVGELPYRDFAVNHFPLLWVLVAPLIKVLPHSPVAMMILRGLALLFNAVFIISLATLISLELPPKERIWAVAFFGLVVFSPPAMQYLIEFRPDPLANTLLFSALLAIRLRGSSRPLIAFASGFCIGVAVLINTKCVLFPCMLGTVAVLIHLRCVRQYLRFLLALCLGFGAALLGAPLLLAWMHIPIGDMWRMVVSYNAAVEKAHTFGYGLAHATIQHPVLLAYVLAGMVCFGCALLREKRMPGMSAITIFLFLALNLVTNTRPWKQYIVQWFFLAAYFPAISLPQILSRLNPQIQIAAAALVLGALIGGICQIDVLDPSGAGENRSSQDHLIDWVSRNVPPDGFVVAGFPMHPIFRRNSFFKIAIDVTGNGDDGYERFMPEIAPGPYGDQFKLAGYENELETRSPSMIVEQAFYSKTQLESLNNFLNRYPNRYFRQIIPGTSIVIFRQRQEY